MKNKMRNLDTHTRPSCGKRCVSMEGDGVKPLQDKSHHQEAEGLDQSPVEPQKELTLWTPDLGLPASRL